MTVRRVIRHVDAFTALPLEGNPAAIVDGNGLDGDVMQRIALNQKLSETVFLLPPQSGENHAWLRIFTPGRELPFAGHPVVAASHVLLSEGHVKLPRGDDLRLETGAGVIPVTVDGDPPMYTMRQAPPAFRPCEIALADIASWVGLRGLDLFHAEYVSTGIEWLVVQLQSFEVMQRTQPNLTALWEHDVAYFSLGAEDAEAAIRVRAFAPSAGVLEDPVTGSANGCIGAYIARRGLLPAEGDEISYVAEQGIEMGQPGRAYLRVTGASGDMSVYVGGHAVTVLEGELLLPD